MNVLRPLRQPGRLPMICGNHVARQIVVVSAILVMALLGFAAPAFALKPIEVKPEQDRIEVTALGTFFEPRGDNMQIETAPGADGLTGRMAVRAATSGTNPSWMVFALTNASDKVIERWLTAERYTIVGSGIVWPDLDARRIEAVTPSIGFIPERIKSDRADIFRVTLDPGQTITYVVEFATDRFTRMYLWKPVEYELKARDRQLFNGIMLGIVGLLALFLTTIFAANHKAIFPTAALVAWCVLAYLCVDFGFFHKLFQLRAEGNAVYRAATESSVAASLVIFLHMFLRLGVWHGFIRVLVGAWIVAQLSLVAVAVIDPRLASTFARLSFVLIGGAGMLFTLFLAARGQDRAVALVPTWLLLLVWIFAASVILTGRLAGDAMVSGLVTGLVLVTGLLGFTVTQFAFRAMEPTHGLSAGELQLRSQALDGSHAAVWQWNARRDEIKVSQHIDAMLGLPPGSLTTSVDDFLQHVHKADQERFRLTLWSVQEQNGGSILVEFRLRHADGSFRWFEVEAASAPASDRRALRCIGLMRDITDARRAQERLLHDAVNDSLTGLPNRELLLDRLTVAIGRAGERDDSHPTIMFVDLDRFRSVNAERGLVVGDSLLLTIARRLQRDLGPADTLARVGGDQFAILIFGQSDPRQLALLAERVRHSVRAPIRIAGEDIVVTSAIGIAILGEETGSALDLLTDAEVAMHRAKRRGPDHIEIFRPEMRIDREERVAVEEDLRRALDRQQVRILYQPIIYLPTEEIAGFQAVVRWAHPKLGQIDPTALALDDTKSDLAVRIGSHVLTTAVQEVARWQRELPRPDRPLFVNVTVSSRRQFSPDLIQEIRHILGRQLAPQGALKLSVAEGLALENPEQTSEILEWLRGAGADLCLDEFGSGYTSFAYLQRFPFEAVRIDRVLVQMSGPDGRGSPLVRGIVALAHELGRKVVADGVENSEDVGFLRSLGCEYAQGFYYGDAMSDKDVVQLLRYVSKSERKLQRRGFFRTKPKGIETGPVDGIAALGAEEPTLAAANDATTKGGRARSEKSAAKARKTKLAPGMTVRQRRAAAEQEAEAAQGNGHARTRPPVLNGAHAPSQPVTRPPQGPPSAIQPLSPAMGLPPMPAGQPPPMRHGAQPPAAYAPPEPSHSAHPAPQQAAADQPYVAPAPSPPKLAFAPTAENEAVPVERARMSEAPRRDRPDAEPPPSRSLSDALFHAVWPADDQQPASEDTHDADPAMAGNGHHGPADHLNGATEDDASTERDDGSAETAEPANGLLPFSAALPSAPLDGGERKSSRRDDEFADGPPVAAPPEGVGQPRHAAGRSGEMPELKTLPPAIAASLARLAGVPFGGAGKPPPGGRPPASEDE